MNFIQYLIQLGYKPFRKVYQNKEWVYIPDNNISYFSSTVPGYTDIRLIKANFEFIYGLNEAGHSPTLIWPRIGLNDDEVNRMLITKNVQEIYDMACKKGGKKGK